MSLDTLWRDVGKEWDLINYHANALAFSIYNQEYSVMNTLAIEVGKLWLNMSRSIDELEFKTYNALRWVELVLVELVDNIDSTIEKRFAWVQHIFNDHLETIINYIEDAVYLVNQSGSMDYDYVDNEIYWAVWDVNQELDIISRRIDDIAGPALSDIEGLIEDAVTEVWTDTLLSINTVKKNLLGKIGSVEDHVDAQIFWLAVKIDTMIEIERAYVDAQAASIKAYVDSLGGDIMYIINLKHSAAKGYTRAKIEEAMIDVGVAVDSVRVELTDAITKVREDLKKYIDNITDLLFIAIINAELRIHDEIQAVSGSIRVLSATTNWRAGFFDIFRSNPELSFLQVLLRDDTKFAEFKPYWQALFTRVMAED